MSLSYPHLSNFFKAYVQNRVQSHKQMSKIKEHGNPASHLSIPNSISERGTLYENKTCKLPLLSWSELVKLKPLIIKGKLQKYYINLRINAEFKSQRLAFNLKLAAVPF